MRLSFTDRCRFAVLPVNLLATVIGSIIGGAVPSAVYWIVHHELDLSQPLYAQPLFYMVLGGLLYSALSVYAVAQEVFQSSTKAFGFVVLVEGSMSLVKALPVSLAMLGILVVINAVSASISLSAQQRDTRRESRKEKESRAKSGGDVLHIAPAVPAAPKAPARRRGTSLSRGVVK